MAALPDVGVTSAGSPKVPQKQQTVGEHLDERIAAVRQQVEEMCILKAKADTLGLLNYPQSFIEKLSFPF